MFDPWTDPPGWLTGLAELTAGVAFFPLVFVTLLQLLRCSGPGRSFCAHFHLRNNGIYDICNKLTSSTFAVLACYSGAYVLARCDRSRLDERFYILDNYLIFGLSYFIYDCASMYMVYRCWHPAIPSPRTRWFFSAEVYLSPTPAGVGLSLQNFKGLLHKVKKY